MTKTTLKMMKMSKRLTFDQTVQFQSVMAHFDGKTMTMTLRMVLMIGNVDDDNENNIKKDKNIKKANF